MRPVLRRILLASCVGLAAVGGAAGSFVAADRAFPPDLSRLDRAGAEILDRQGLTLAMQPAPGGVWRLRTTADQVSPVFLDILVRTEDRRFWQHRGVDLLALLRAAWQGLRAGRVVSGGSTLTMQAARLLEPRPRTLRSKLIEAFRAVQLEERFSKRDILGIWLTLAPFGGNLEGVRAGSQAWFGKRPAALDRAEAALLVAIPRRPEGLRPDRHPDRALALRNRLLGEDAGAERDEALPLARIRFPRHAEPALRRLLAASPHPDGLQTTLDLPLQRAVEAMIADRLSRLPPRVSMAVMVADAGTRTVLAAASGAGGPARAGALNLTAASRSPGSALKPMLYGVAFQDGLVTPSTQVNDLPRHFGGYAPENFDRSFAGPVTAAEALRRSLNLPAVALLDRIGPTRFAARLNAAGAALRLPPGAAPSLPLALGGAGISLRDLLRLYAALATDGTSLPLRLEPGGADRPGAAAVAAQRRPPGGRRDHPRLPRRRSRGGGVEDRHQLGRPRRLGHGVRRAQRRRRVDGAAGRHGRAGLHRGGDRAARAGHRVRPAPARAAPARQRGRGAGRACGTGRGVHAAAVPPARRHPVRRRSGAAARHGRPPSARLCRGRRRRALRPRQPQHGLAAGQPGLLHHHGGGCRWCGGTRPGAGAVTVRAVRRRPEAAGLAVVGLLLGSCAARGDGRVARVFDADGITRVVLRAGNAADARLGTVPPDPTAVAVSGLPRGGAEGYHPADPNWRETPAAEWGLDFVARRFGATLVISTKNEIEYIHHHYDLEDVAIQLPGRVALVREPRRLSADGAANLSPP